MGTLLVAEPLLVRWMSLEGDALALVRSNTVVISFFSHPESTSTTSPQGDAHVAPTPITTNRTEPEAHRASQG